MARPDFLRLENIKEFFENVIGCDEGVIYPDSWDSIVSDFVLGGLYYHISDSYANIFDYIHNMYRYDPYKTVYDGSWVRFFGWGDSYPDELNLVGEYPRITTIEPTQDNEAGEIICLLDKPPVQKYQGYIYYVRKV